LTKAGTGDNHPRARKKRQLVTTAFEVQSSAFEFSPQGVGSDPTIHVHTIYLDPTND
jgi:hypothetical protein